MSVLGNNLLAEYYAQNQGLPFGYEAVEYLESTGTQWIDTGVYVNQDTNVTIDYCNVINSNLFSVFGVQPFFVFTVPDNTNILFRYNYLTYINSLSQLTRAKRSMNGNVVLINGEVVHTFAKSPFVSRYTALLFARRLNSNGTIEEKAKAHIWSCKIDESRNFIPCIRKSDSKPGLYDLCKSICPLTGTPFYINAGTGEFVTP